MSCWRKQIPNDGIELLQNYPLVYSSWIYRIGGVGLGKQENFYYIQLQHSNLSIDKLGDGFRYLPFILKDDIDIGIELSRMHHH